MVEILAETAVIVLTVCLKWSCFTDSDPKRFITMKNSREICFTWKAKYPIFKAIVAGFRGKVAFKKIGHLAFHIFFQPPCQIQSFEWCKDAFKASFEANLLWPMTSALLCETSTKTVKKYCKRPGELEEYYCSWKKSCTS